MLHLLKFFVFYRLAFNLVWGISPLSSGERQGYRGAFRIDPRTSLPHLEVILGPWIACARRSQVRSWPMGCSKRYPGLLSPQLPTKRVRKG